MLSNQNLIQQWTITRDYYQARHACKKNFAAYIHIYGTMLPQPSSGLVKGQSQYVIKNAEFCAFNFVVLGGF